MGCKYKETYRIVVGTFILFFWVNSGLLPIIYDTFGFASVKKKF